MKNDSKQKRSKVFATKITYKQHFNNYVMILTIINVGIFFYNSQLFLKVTFDPL